MKPITLKQFSKTAPSEDVEAFIHAFCGSSRNQFHQITGGHRNFAATRVPKIVKWFKDRGYNIPAVKLRPDIFESI